ncbi:MAG: WecB/TagA/CpsF family glycosyltransferase, partial [Planctomycetota bacterium]|nr:WecB/TagA/CpsF family glycosyltransferase [Planctomycetota bacterium]
MVKLEVERPAWARWERRELMGLPVDLVTRSDVLDAVPWLVEEDASHHLVALNPIKVMRAQNEDDLRAGIRDAALVYPDAVGISWAIRMLHRRRIPVLPGCELMLDLFALADREQYGVYLVGARADVLEQVEKKLRAEHPGIHIVGSHHGY